MQSHFLCIIEPKQSYIIARLKQIDFIKRLNISHTTFTKHLVKGTYYLGKYQFTREIVNDAVMSELSVFELQNILKADRVVFNRNKPKNSNSTSVVLLNQQTQTKTCLFSLGEAVQHIKSLGYSVSQKDTC